MDLELFVGVEPGEAQHALEGHETKGDDDAARVERTLAAHEFVAHDRREHRFVLNVPINQRGGEKDDSTGEREVEWDGRRHQVETRTGGVAEKEFVVLQDGEGEVLEEYPFVAHQRDFLDPFGSQKAVFM